MNRRHFVKVGARAMGLALMAGTSFGGQNNQPRSMRTTMKIKLNSVFVEDQDQALEFYTKVLGFVKKHDMPLGAFKWLTVVSPEEPEGTELLLEPNENPAAKTFQKAMYEQGIPLTAFAVADLDLEYERLTALGVKFPTKPTVMPSTKIAVLDDNCGNLIQLYQMITRPER